MWLEPENPQDPYNRLNPSVAGGASIGAGGGAGQPAGTSSNPSTQTPIQPQQPKQEFATVQDYLKGNQQQGEQLGQQVTSNLATNLTGEKNAINTAAEGAKSDITAGTVNYDPNLVSKAVTNPTEVAGSPDQLQSFLKQWNAAYQGPTSFESSKEYAPAAAAQTEAQNKAAETATTGGQQQLLQEQFGVYGQGNKALDQAVLQGSSAYPTLQQQGKEFSNIPNYLAAKSAEINPMATAGQATSAATQQQTQKAFENNLTNMQNKIAANVAANQQYVKERTPIGITPDLTGINAATVATPEDYAKAAAYQTLTGVNYGGVLNPANVGQANTANRISQMENEIAAIRKTLPTNMTSDQQAQWNAMIQQYRTDIDKLRAAGGYSQGSVTPNMADGGEVKNLKDYFKRNTR